MITFDLHIVKHVDLRHIRKLSVILGVLRPNDTNINIVKDKKTEKISFTEILNAKLLLLLLAIHR